MTAEPLVAPKDLHVRAEAHGFRASASVTVTDPRHPDARRDGAIDVSCNFDGTQERSVSGATLQAEGCTFTDVLEGDFAESDRATIASMDSALDSIAKLS